LLSMFVNELGFWPFDITGFLMAVPYPESGMLIP